MSARPILRSAIRLLPVLALIAALVMAAAGFSTFIKARVLRGGAEARCCTA